MINHKLHAGQDSTHGRRFNLNPNETFNLSDPTSLARVPAGISVGHPHKFHNKIPNIHIRTNSVKLKKLEKELKEARMRQDIFEEIYKGIKNRINSNGTFVWITIKALDTIIEREIKFSGSEEKIDILIKIRDEYRRVNKMSNKFPNKFSNQ